MTTRRDRLLTCCILLGCLAVAVSVSGCRSSTSMTTSGVQLPAIMPADFGFIARDGPWPGDSVDTFTGRFTKNVNSQTGKPNPTVELRLTNEELAGLYQDLRSIHILDYPSEFHPRTRWTASTPNGYHLYIRTGGIEKEISWGYADDFIAPEAKALRDWFKTLRVIIEAKPEYQRMPPMEQLYM
jgi:hypothetical protein